MLTRLTGLVVSLYSNSFFNEIGNTIKDRIGDRRQGNPTEFTADITLCSLILN
jgi:hypothetical protein